MSNEVATAMPTALAAANGGGMLPRGNAATMVAQTREMAEAVAAMQMAKMCPRDVVAARDRILNSCTRVTLAKGACYTYAKGGTEVTGPSIRLAEMLAQNWGNMSFGIRELEQRNGESTCEAFAWDMETNARQTKIFQVAHLRHTKKGDYPLTDPREIYELVANNGARRLRACILGIIPGDIVEEAVEACRNTLEKDFKVTPERIKAMAERFAEYGVTKEQIEAKCQCRIEAIRPAQLVNLGNIYNSLKDGMSKPGDWFEVEDADGAESRQSAKEALRARLTAKAGKSPDPTPSEAAQANGEASDANPAREEEIPY